MISLIQVSDFWPIWASGTPEAVTDLDKYFTDIVQTSLLDTVQSLIHMKHSLILGKCLTDMVQASLLHASQLVINIKLSLILGKCLTDIVQASLLDTMQSDKH